MCTATTLPQVRGLTGPKRRGQRRASCVVRRASCVVRRASCVVRRASCVVNSHSIRVALCIVEVKPYFFLCVGPVSGESFEDLPSPGGLGIRRAVVAAPLTCTSGEIPTYPVLDGHGHVSQFRQRGSPSRLKEDVKGRPARIVGEPGITLVRSATGGDLREDTVRDDEVPVSI